MSTGSHPGNTGHALIAAADLQRALATNLLLPLPHSQEEQQPVAVQPARQAGPAAPCRATWQAVPAPGGCCSAAGAVRSAACRGPCTCRGHIDHTCQQNHMKTAPIIVWPRNYNVDAVKVLW
jgi:hypothetical protein